MSKDSIMKQFEEAENFFKAQIVGGANSDPKTWAGSSSSEEDFPNVTPGGTDYEPKPGNQVKHVVSNKRSAKKAIFEMTDQELERELQFRKSSVPNPVQADYEIMSTVPNVSKAVCKDCHGNSLYKGMYCGTCNNLGVTYHVETQQSADMVKSIQAKWNLHHIDENFWKAKKAMEVEDVEDETEMPDLDEYAGDMVAKGEEAAEMMEDCAEDMDKGMDMDMDDIDEMDDMDKGSSEVMMEDLAEDMDKCKKGIAMALKGMAFIARRQNALLKGGLLNASLSKSLSGQLGGMEQDVNWLVQSLSKAEGQVSKSINAPAGPARAPRAAFRDNLQVIQKSHVDQAPGQDLGYTGATTEGHSPNGIKHSYDYTTLRKAATHLAIKGKINRRDAMIMETGQWPEEKIEKALVAFLNKNDGEVPSSMDE